MPTTQSMPLFLKSASPSPGSFMEGGPSQICITINTRYMVESGDDLTTPEAVLNKIIFELNGDTELSLADVGYELTETEITFPDGSTASYLTEYLFCWEATFVEGFNKASVTLLKKSGDPQTYQWYFEAISP